MLHQKVKDGSVEQAEAAVRDMFATLARMRLEGIRYASTRVANRKGAAVVAGALSA